MELLTERRANKPRKHHFLPASYLRNFCSDDERLYVYQRDKMPRISSPASEAHIRDFYAYEDENGKNFAIEEILSRYEGLAAPVIQGIIEREANSERRLLTKRETDILAFFVALTFVRVPAGRKLDTEYIAPAVKRLLTQAAQNKEDFFALIRDIPGDESLSETEKVALIEDSRLRILNGYYDEPEPPGFRLHAMLHVASMISYELQKYACMIVVATKHETFITGDTPVVNISEENEASQLGTSFEDEKTSVWFPIASKVCLAWRRGIPPGYGKLPPRGVRMINRNVMRYSERFIYCSSYSQKLADVFSRVKQQVFLGKNAFVPMLEGKPVFKEECSCEQQDK